MTKERWFWLQFRGGVALVTALGAGTHAQSARSAAHVAAPYAFNDAHFHLTNYIQRGINLRAFLEIMGTRVGRVAVFGIARQRVRAWEARALANGSEKTSTR